MSDIKVIRTTAEYNMIGTLGYRIAVQYEDGTNETLYPEGKVQAVRTVKALTKLDLYGAKSVVDRAEQTPHISAALRDKIDSDQDFRDALRSAVGSF
jgi:ribosomal protein L7/L12